MRRSGAVLAAVVAAAAGGAAAEDRFDLVCRGVSTDLANVRTEVSARFRIDLALGRWCLADCEQTSAFADVGPDVLFFSRSEANTPTERHLRYARVSRISGEWREVDVEMRPYPHSNDIRGQCESAPFSGFPTARF